MVFCFGKLTKARKIFAIIAPKISKSNTCPIGKIEIAKPPSAGPAIDESD